jgi:Family of unknown function (DUF5946)
MTNDELNNELAYYTLSHPDPSFLHQHIVDAYAAQCASEGTKTIQIVFGLVGLYLYLEKGFSGKKVQKAHMQLAKQRRNWERPALPADRGAIGIVDVLAAAPGEPRDLLIAEWCRSVWYAWRTERNLIVSLVQSELGIG